MDKLGQSIEKDYENFFPRFWGPYYDPGNRVARRIVLEILSEDIKRSKNLLDIGGGVGDVIIKLESTWQGYKDFFLLDFSYDSLRKAKEYAKSKKLNINLMAIQGDASKLPIKSDAINIITCRETLEHIKDDKSAAQEMFRILKLRGKALIHVPVEGKPTVWAGHFRCYTKKKLSRLFDEIGFEVIECIFICKLARFLWGYPKFLIYIIWLLLTGNIIKRIKKVEFPSYYNSWFHRKIVMPLFDKILALDYIFSVRGKYKSGANILVVGRKS
ncbi:methyltransferase domain-containing protein [candidate division WOR-3 bacterium]|nr:methyltransferase domain-containing protein [candidate division WOR-3 bacterium]